VENIEDILTSLRVETRRVAVRSTDWLGDGRTSPLIVALEFFIADCGPKP
jgi:hypothetical protein